MKTRKGYYSEQVRDASFKEIVNDVSKLNKNCSIVFEQLRSGPKTMHEISVLTGMEVHLVSARLSDLRKEDYVIATKEKRINPVSGKPNTLWKLDQSFQKPEQLKIF